LSAADVTARAAARAAHANGNGNGNGHRKGTVPAVTVVIPSRDERENVAELVARLESVAPGFPLEILFVDDSDDGTPDAVRAAARDSKRPVRLIHRAREERTGGLGGAVLEGMRAAHAPWVCVMDADLQHPPEVLEQLIERALRGDVDAVVGSRFCGDGGVGDDFGPFRRLVSRTSSAVAGALFRGSLRQVTDPMSGFFMVRLDAVDLDELRPHGFKILLEILVRARRLRVAEVPFTFGERFAGESKASAREGLNYLTHLWRLRLGELSARMGRFGLVGVSGLLVNTLALAALSDLVGLWYVVAAAIATQVSTAWNFALTELWVFGDRRHARAGMRRLVMFFAVNNVALALRAPILIGLTEGLGVHYLASNFISLLVVFVARFTLADLWIWKGSDELADGLTAHNYDIHGIVSVASHVRLPELERFRIAEQLTAPTIKVGIGSLRRREDHPASIRYVEYRGLGFAAEIRMGTPIEVTASKLLRFSPHVLYTNVVEPILRWTFVGKGYALVHAACMAHEGYAFLITARTDTGKTTTCLKTLDSQPYAFVSDDLTLLTPDGRVLTYPKPLTISRHTLHAVKRPRLTRRERFMLIYQSRLHSKSGRWFGLLLAKLHLPAATMNAIVQLLVPPPKYQFDRLVPHAELAPEARLAGMVIIQRGGEGGEVLPRDEALGILLENCEDAYGFPPYPQIESFLHSRNGADLVAMERQIIEMAMGETPAMLLRSESRDWHTRLPAIVSWRIAANGNGGRNARRAPVAAAASPSRAS
jgi:dolichol-phosphate mannosyltransferase